MGKLDVQGGKPREEGNELPFPQFIAHHFPPVFHADHVDFLTIRAGKRGIGGHWSICKLNRRGDGSLKEAGPFLQCPNASSFVPRRLENEISSIWRPAPAALIGRIVPTRKDGSKMSSIRPNLPYRAGLGLRITQGESKLLAIHGPSWPPWDTDPSHQFA